MALNLQTLKTRSLTAVIFVAVMLTGLLWNQWAFITLFMIVHFGCWFEFIRLLKKIRSDGYQKYAVLGLLYITAPVMALIDLVLNPPSPVREQLNSGNNSFFIQALIPCMIIFSIWINDTMAYIVGSLIGRTPFSKISPKKTWEGTAGGAILCTVVIALAGNYFFPFIDVRHWIHIAGLCAIFGTLGDLLESKLKRMAEVKDSGNIMPGHGGFLDRFDSLIVAAPVVWLYVRLFL